MDSLAAAVWTARWHIPLEDYTQLRLLQGRGYTVPCDSLLFMLFFLFSVSREFFPDLVDEKFHGLFLHIHIKPQGADKRKQL